MIYLAFVVARIAILGAAIWFARSRNPGVHAVAILLLLADLFSLWLAYSLVLDPRAYWLGGPILIWVLGGPFILAAVLFEAAAVAPVIVLASLICAGAVVFWSGASCVALAEDGCGRWSLPLQGLFRRWWCSRSGSKRRCVPMPGAFPTAAACTGPA